MLNTAKAAMSKALKHAKIRPYRGSDRGHANHGWFDSYHSFSFASWYNPDYTQFGALRVLNEDRLAASSGLPHHPHRDFEIFTYMITGELTHRDSMVRKDAKVGADPKTFYRMQRGDVQFTTAGTGITHSEYNDNKETETHLLQIWVMPWKKGLPPIYHTKHFSEEAKRSGFVTILSPLKAGPEATAQEEEAAVPVLDTSIPIHSDFSMGAGIIAPGLTFSYKIGNDVTTNPNRKVFVHLPMTQGGKAQIKIDGRDDLVLSEGDGAFIEAVHAGDELSVENVGSVDAEVVVLDTA